MRNIYKTGKELFITSNEEIKEGDWFYNISSKIKYKATKQLIDLIDDLKLNANKKIILTTDPELIKDNVQSIPDEFLEWFVQNPSCEWVEVENKYYYKGSNNEIPSHISLENLGGWGYGKRKIIIPNEKPKQTDEKGNPMTYWGGLAEPKQETLEEAAERLVPGINKKFGRELFIAGAKWQAEKMKFKK